MTRIDWPTQQLSLSKLAFGCASIMGRVGKREALKAMAMAFDAGVTHFDVARSYGFGDAERIVGRFAATRRGRMTVATKFGIQPQPLGLAKRAARPLVRLARRVLPGADALVRRGSGSMLVAGHYSLADARTSLEISLRELRLDAIDLLFVHECRRAEPVQDDVIAWLEQLKTQGIIRAWGFATGGGDADHYRSVYRAPDVVFQRELRVQDMGEATTGLICHAPFSLLHDCLTRAPAAVRARFDAWTRAHELRNEDLPALLLESTLHSGAGQVILCSMFNPAHVRANTRCLTEPRFPAGLRREFVQQLADLVPAIEAV